MNDIVIIGAGPAGRAAAALLPAAIVIARPAATVWHAEPGRVWIEDADGVRAHPFARLLLCADEPLLLLALGVRFAGSNPAVDHGGATNVAGVFAAGRILGAATPEDAARQGRIAAQTLAGLTPEGRIDPLPAEAMPAAPRLDPLDIAQLLNAPPGPGRNRAALAQTATRGPVLASLIAPARPVGLAALAAFAPASLTAAPMQQDTGALSPARQETRA